MKKCTKCGIEKPLTAEYYYRQSSNSSGFSSQCKVCKAEYHKNNREKILERKAEYYRNNKEKINKQAAEYHKNNREKILKRGAEYYRNNKEKIAKRDAEYYRNNKEKINKRDAEYYQDKKAQQPACVYQIVNKISGKTYIGETIRGELRWKRHLLDLKRNRHINPKLQADFDKFGKEAFEWSIIKEVDKDKDTLLLEEIKTIDRFLREGKELYNLSLTIDQLKLLMENK